MSKTPWLKKYTKLDYLEATLQQRQLHLGNPEDWDDKNDSACIRAYSASCGGFEMRATCLTGAADQFHFWHVFGEREKGVCLWFEKNSLRNDIVKDGSLDAREVKYQMLKSLSRLKPHEIPFTKRKQYSDEREFRVLRVKDAQNTATDKFAFSAGSLRKIYLNPWLTLAESKREKSRISDMLENDLRHVTVLQNRTLKNESWIDAVSEAVRPPR